MGTLMRPHEASEGGLLFIWRPSCSPSHRGKWFERVANGIPQMHMILIREGEVFIWRPSCSRPHVGAWFEGVAIVKSQPAPYTDATREQRSSRNHNMGTCPGRRGWGRPAKGHACKRNNVYMENIHEMKRLIQIETTARKRPRAAGRDHKCNMSRYHETITGYDTRPRQCYRDGSI